MDALTARRFAELDAATLYMLVKLRVEVFIVEQNCPYQDLDELDTDPGTWHVWIGRGSGAAGYLRILTTTDGYRIGRVCTAHDARGQGLGERLMEHAVSMTVGRPVVLNAQTYATGFYRRFGFEPFGEEFLEDGIRHIAMRRA